MDLLGLQLFPPLAEVLEMVRQDPRWPPSWWPLSSDLHHYMVVHDETGVGTCWRDTDEPGVLPVRLYGSLGDALEALGRMIGHLDESAIVSSREGAWVFKRLHKHLDAHIVAAMAEGWARHRGPIVLPWHGHLLTKDQQHFASPLAPLPV
ncbi:MAG: hypothetical protein AAGE01_22560 [Pseudomonadota bacterium]